MIGWCDASEFFSYNCISQSVLFVLKHRDLPVQTDGSRGRIKFRGRVTSTLQPSYFQCGFQLE